MCNLVSKVVTPQKLTCCLWQRQSKQPEQLLSLWLSFCLTYHLHLYSQPPHPSLHSLWHGHHMAMHFPGLNITYLASHSWCSGKVSFWPSPAPHWCPHGSVLAQLLFAIYTKLTSWISHQTNAFITTLTSTMISSHLLPLPRLFKILKSRLNDQLKDERAHANRADEAPQVSCK